MLTPQQADRLREVLKAYDVAVVTMRIDGDMESIHACLEVEDRIQREVVGMRRPGARDWGVVRSLKWAQTQLEAYDGR